MKVIGIQIKSNEAIIVVVEKTNDNIKLLNDHCTKIKIEDHHVNDEVKQFKNQITTTFDSIHASKIGIISRAAIAKGKHAPSPLSFKLEGIIQLYEATQVQFISKQTLAAYFKKNPSKIETQFNYQQDALNLALYLLK